MVRLFSLAMILLVSVSWAQDTDLEDETDPSEEDPVEISTPSAVIPVESTRRSLPLKEYSVQILGVLQFPQLHKLKEGLKKKLPEDSSLFEKSISRGSIILALRTSLDYQALRDQMGTLAIDSGRLDIRSEDSESIQILIR